MSYRPWGGQADALPIDTGIAPKGPLAAYVTHRATFDEFSAFVEWQITEAEEVADLFPRLRVFELEPPTRMFQAPTLDAVPDRYEAWLRASLPVSDRPIRDGVLGPLDKYGLLHECRPAPRDDATGLAMWLEVSGKIVGWRPFEALPQPPLTVEIHAVTWSNIEYAGYKMPFYM